MRCKENVTPTTVKPVELGHIWHFCMTVLLNGWAQTHHPGDGTKAAFHDRAPSVKQRPSFRSGMSVLFFQDGNIFQRTLIVIGTPLVGPCKSATWASLVEPDVNFICGNDFSEACPEFTPPLSSNRPPPPPQPPPCLIWTLTWLLCKYGITLSHLHALRHKTSTRPRRVLSYNGDRATTG